MFFDLKSRKKLPRELKKEIEKLYKLEEEIYRRNQKNKNVNKLVLLYSISSLQLFLNYSKRASRSLKKEMIDAVSEIPVVLFVVNEIKVDKRIERLLSPLIGIDIPALSYQKKYCTISKTLENLKKLKKTNYKNL